MIYSTLKRGPWRKKAPRKGTPKREMYEERMRRVAAAKARDLALTWGCEYSSVFLLAVYKLHGCAACSRHDPTGPHRHHIIHRSRKGFARNVPRTAHDECDVPHLRKGTQPAQQDDV